MERIGVDVRQRLIDLNEHAAFLHNTKDFRYLEHVSFVGMKHVLHRNALHTKIV